MTTLIVWAAIDQRSTSAVYMASDSRLSWGSSGYWDAGRKVFASEKFPEILGYTGDALFCSQVLSQIVAFIDSCSYLQNSQNFRQKFVQIEALLKNAFEDYPTQFSLPAFSIIYLTRVKEQWCACTFSWQKEAGWQGIEEHHIPLNLNELTRAEESEKEKAIILVSAGSGGEKFRAHYHMSGWNKDLPLLSRGVFGAFCDFIELGIRGDKSTGGKPQISGLYRNHRQAAIKMGYVENDVRYLYGIAISAQNYPGTVRWVNRTFENCEPGSGKLAPGAQRQPPPTSAA